MIIPVRCFTCGKVLADKWNSYIEQVQKHYNNDIPEYNSMRIVDIQKNEESAEKKILDEMRIKRYCCRRVMLSTIDLVDKI
jgi:DNA-directed RNA polymerase subunit N (RpoN/RPB10)|tara:strand:- start:94 stop:336 length:243 start_codon:yes stop_codon:yes gene_type:complete